MPKHYMWSRISLISIIDSETPTSATAVPTRRSKKASNKKIGDTANKASGELSPGLSKSSASAQAPLPPAAADSEDDDGQGSRAFDADDGSGDDTFSSGFLGAGGSSAGIASDLHRRLQEMSSGGGSRFRAILERLKQKDQFHDRREALLELSNLLLISTEDNLSGHFSPDQFVVELVILMQANQFDLESSETELLACRCLANLMEALPQSTANVVYGGAVPVLTEKLVEFADLDMPEQVLSVSLPQLLTTCAG
jgi:E3 ubiquitin-protein ligase TRIP12